MSVETLWLFHFGEMFYIKPNNSIYLLDIRTISEETYIIQF